MGEVGELMEQNTVQSMAALRKPKVPVLENVDPTAADGLKTIFERLANNQPDWFPNGIQQVDFVELNDGTIANTDQAGGFSFSSRPLKEFQNQSPSSVVQRAIKRIQNRKALTRQDEEALCAVWHEIRHNMQPPFPGYDQGKNRKIMETLREVVTRHTFEYFAAELGFVPQHIKNIRQKGLGYHDYVRNFNYIAKQAGWIDPDFKLKPEVVKMLDKVDRFDPSGQPPGGNIVLDVRKYIMNAAERIAATLGNGKPEAANKMKDFLDQMVEDGIPKSSGFGELVVKTIRRA